MYVYKIADNIVSSLGLSTEENWAALSVGRSGLKRYEGFFRGTEPFMASLVDMELLDRRFRAIGGDISKYTRFERMAIVSIAGAIEKTGISPADSRTLFILSTTKGNVSLLDEPDRGGFGEERVYLGAAAGRIASFFGNEEKPLVVSNACISGISAQIMAARLLRGGRYDRVIVVGADEVSRFVVSGFQCLKALSPEPCTPYDAGRIGLNLGEGAATVIWGITDECREEGQMVLESGAITNDANHISGPSRTGEGLYLALVKVTDGIPVDDIGFLNAHGTATLYNDEMESIAIGRSCLNEVEVNSFKGYFGHTLGAAGVMESVICMASLQHDILLASKGYSASGVSHPLRVIEKTRKKRMNLCVKTASGFGGCNAAIRIRKITMR